VAGKKRGMRGTATKEMRQLSREEAKKGLSTGLSIRVPRS